MSSDENNKKKETATLPPAPTPIKAQTINENFTLNTPKSKSTKDSDKGNKTS